MTSGEPVAECADSRLRIVALRWRAHRADADHVPTPRFLRRVSGRVRAVASRGRPRAYQRRSARVSIMLGYASWAAVLVSGAVILLTPSAGSGRKVAESAVVILTVNLFAMLSARMISAAIAWRERRVVTLVWLAAIALWGVGSSVVTSTSQPDMMSFPSPGEGFFLASYVLMAAFLALDATDRSQLTPARLLEAVVTCGGGVCLAGALLVSPLDQRLDEGGIAELLALLYPLLDLLLLLIVIGDVALRRRALDRRTMALLVGFAGFAVADTTFIRNLAGGAYDFSSWLLLLWATSLTMLAAGGCGPRIGLTADEKERESSWLPLGAAGAAVSVLVITPSGSKALYLTIPAVITLVAAGIRLALALRAARGAAEAYRLSLTDELTGLPNRRALLSRIHDHLDDDTPLSLLLVDLDGFKEVNDTLGHIAGDSVLRLLANRLRGGLGTGGLGAGAMLARLGGDEFAVVLPVSDAGRALAAAEQLRTLIAEPIEAHDHLFSMNASVGVALRTVTAIDPQERPTDSSELLRRADIAMYQAKHTRAGQLLYDRARDEFTTDRLKLAEYLRYGIAAGELRVWYQPQIEASDWSLSGLEALVRWQHPELGLLPPGDFLAVARHSGLMPALTEAVIGLVLNDVRSWTARGLEHRVSFNFAPPELLNQSLLERVLSRIDAMELPPGALVLEVTEDSFLAEPERAKRALIELRRHHVQVSIDDYGTGFSSLSYLRDLPVNELKLDRSFIRAIGSDQRSSIIVESTTQMARGLGLRTVAEGVEDAVTMDRVREMGIDAVQGYHIARPMPAAHVESWMANRVRPDVRASQA